MLILFSALQNDQGRIIPSIERKVHTTRRKLWLVDCSARILQNPKVHENLIVSEVFNDILNLQVYFKNL